MKIGQEGDNRPWRRRRKDEFYALKKADENAKKYIIPRCRVCGIVCEGATFGKPPKDITCFRCHNEKVSE